MATTRSGKIIILWLFAVLATTPVFAGANGGGARDFASYTWTEINGNASSSPRAGLQVVSLGGDFYLMGGRTPRAPSFPPIPGDSDIWGDVWKSSDLGASWRRILETDDTDHWPARAYFRAVEQGRTCTCSVARTTGLLRTRIPAALPSSRLPSSSMTSGAAKDGVRWRRMTADAGWDGRAGLSAVVFKDEIFVMGGSFNDDPAVIGGPPTRVYLNDVWKSKNGRRWTLVTEHAPWAPRAGAVMVVKNGYMYLLGGEDGFICLPGGRCPPYYNDVWRSRDGANWELVTESAAWAARPGHQAATTPQHHRLVRWFRAELRPGESVRAGEPHGHLGEQGRCFVETGE